MADEPTENPETTEQAEAPEGGAPGRAGRAGGPARGRGRAPPGRGRAPPGRGRAPPGRGRAPPGEGDAEKKEGGEGDGEKKEGGEGDEEGTVARGDLKPQITIKKFNAVAKWTQGDGMHTHCAICRNNLMDLCIEAHGSGKGCDDANGTCLIAVGQCQHHFHNCCLSRFLKDHSTCPACGGRDWVLHHLDKQV
eukprot:TRINITY_DN2185_c0_g1_i1.p1 TRINITY_DN2185_c0_g1~~TRINITY_DN2185_c0_g1_i1.p1  ORF type:complete len:193 (-),score=1.60 TRINITY_DN2185_c0_g1_i1:18-596(-)